MSNLRFPIKGLHRGFVTEVQPELTSPDLNNVRPFDVLDQRARGGQRPGLDKAYAQQIGGEASPIVELLAVTVVDR